MSKKTQSGNSSSITHSHTAEHRIIKHDLIKVVVLNVIYLAGVLAIYFTNQKSHYLERWFSNIHI